MDPERTTPRPGATDRAAHSRPRPGGQRRVGAALLLAALGLGAAPAPPPAAAPPHATPSGLPVPRYVSMKFREVNARGGPGDDHRMLWTYRARGLPLQVVAETDEWRRVCDPEGGLAWVHKRTVAEARTVMRTAGRDLPMRVKPAESARVNAVLASRSLAALGKCDRGWCRITADKTAGWVRASELWGTDAAPQCR